MAKTTPLPIKTYAALSPIGVQDENGTFIKIMPGQLVDLTDPEHDALMKLRKVGADPIEPPKAS